jgi:hypothetical protein
MGLRGFVYLVWALAGLALSSGPTAAIEKSGIKAIRKVYENWRTVERAAKPSKAFAVYTDENYNQAPRWVRALELGFAPARVRGAA